MNVKSQQEKKQSYGDKHECWKNLFFGEKNGLKPRFVSLAICEFNTVMRKIKLKTHNDETGRFDIDSQAKMIMENDDHSE